MVTDGEVVGATEGASEGITVGETEGIEVSGDFVGPTVGVSHQS